VRDVEWECGGTNRVYRTKPTKVRRGDQTGALQKKRQRPGIYHGYKMWQAKTHWEHLEPPQKKYFRKREGGKENEEKSVNAKTLRLLSQGRLVLAEPVELSQPPALDRGGEARGKDKEGWGGWRGGGGGGKHDIS